MTSLKRPNLDQSKREVPRLDLLHYIHGSELQKKKFSEELFKGLKEYGFIILSNHNVTDEMISEAYSALQSFFELPVEVKEKYYIKKYLGQRGYTPFGREHAKNNPFPDLKEFFHIGRDPQDKDLDNPLFPPNLFPSEIEKFENIFRKFYATLDQTSHYLLEALESPLSLPTGFFKEMISGGNSIIRGIHYPPVKGLDTTQSIRAGAHGDINLITLLVGATASGLELLDRDGSWLPVVNGPGEIVVDTGDMMAKLTNHLLPATIHRVINPEDETGARFSMPFFVHPHSEASLKVIPHCQKEGEEYEELLAKNYLMKRLEDIGLSY